eukprot:CAMPEP_0113525484 /NCGR_PEP_ID=MMETSP0015_2-20120614/189_1 /TAXON_ID=2838 /ORGANISM="Odontella" /LENGTH=38 /DNA_ID=CAMNT_0000423659 /DNA_START=55 /DNA_END=171 /DNA_ORIENTATION=+ /assembly_acc=CAM_ASM_000160
MVLSLGPGDSILPSLIDSIGLEHIESKVHRDSAGLTPT